MNENSRIFIIALALVREVFSTLKFLPQAINGLAVKSAAATRPRSFPGRGPICLVRAGGHKGWLPVFTRPVENSRLRSRFPKEIPAHVCPGRDLPSRQVRVSLGLTVLPHCETSVSSWTIGVPCWSPPGIGEGT